MKNQILIPASRTPLSFKIQDKAYAISLRLPLHEHFMQ